jgi:hypothetical protein
MESVDFEITKEQLGELISSYPNIGKNSHVGHIAVKVVELFFLSKYPDATFSRGTKGADIEVLHSGKTERYEVKGTIDPEISWSKLKVSSQDCYNCLVEGMVLIRVTNIGNTQMKLYFMKYGEDFTLEKEVRYAVKKLKKAAFS